MMTGPQADFWYPVDPAHARHTGQWYSENTMQGILSYRGQVTQALPGQTNRLVAKIGDIEALGGYVRTSAWNDYEIIARGGVMMHIINGQLMAIFIRRHGKLCKQPVRADRFRDRKSALPYLRARYLASHL